MRIRTAFILAILTVAASAASKIKVAGVGNSITVGRTVHNSEIGGTEKMSSSRLYLKEQARGKPEKVMLVQP